MSKPVGTVAYRTFGTDDPNAFDVAIHTNEGWVVVDQHGPYEFQEPRWDRPSKWPWTILVEPKG